MTNPMSVKFAALTKPSYIHLEGGDKDTAQLMRDAALGNFFSGMSVGTNTITGDKIDGLTNRNASYKDIAFFEKNGYYASPSMAWIA